MKGGNGHLKGLYKFSITTLSWMIRSREMKIKSLKEEIKMIKGRIRELKREEKNENKTKSKN